MLGHHSPGTAVPDLDGGVFVEGMLGHVGQEHRYADRVMDVTPESKAAFYEQRMQKDAAGIYTGVAGNIAAVELGEVEPGTFWLIEQLTVENALTTDVGFAYVRLGSAVAPARCKLTMDAGGAYSAFDPPLYLPRSKVFVTCRQTAVAASSVFVSAQVRVVAIVT